jgi:hypothetical protein
MAELAVRAAPAVCAILDDGVRLDLAPDGTLPPEALVVQLDGSLGRARKELPEQRYPRTGGGAAP